MTRKTFTDLMNETFLTGDASGTTTTTASAEPAPSLTLDTLLKLRRKFQDDYPVTYYIASEHVDDKTTVYKLLNEYARCGYDLICHPDVVPTLMAKANHSALLRPLDDKEIDRRTKLMVR